MSQSERKEFIEKLHWELNYTLRDITLMLNKSWWSMVYYRKNYNIKVKPRLQSLLDKYGGHGPNWNGGRYKNKLGYWMLWVGKNYPGAWKTGVIKEHRYVMANKIGRPLEKKEHVHHIDGDRGNNNPDNLQLMTAGGRGKFHGIPMFCPQCGFEIKQTFE